jgi:hypothetical protein
LQQIFQGHLGLFQAIFNVIDHLGHIRLRVDLNHCLLVEAL